MRFYKQLIIAVLLIALSAPVAQFIGEPSLSAWGLFAGLAILGAFMSHYLRKTYFPYIKLEDFADMARGNPTGAGLVFLGVSLVLAALVQSMSGLVRM